MSFASKHKTREDLRKLIERQKIIKECDIEDLRAKIKKFILECELQNKSLFITIIKELHFILKQHNLNFEDKDRLACMTIVLIKCITTNVPEFMCEKYKSEILDFLKCAFLRTFFKKIDVLNNSSIDKHMKVLQEKSYDNKYYYMENLMKH